MCSITLALHLLTLAPIVIVQAVGSQWFEYTLLVCIIASSVCLTMDTIDLDRDSQRGHALFVLDIIFTSAFLLEVRDTVCSTMQAPCRSKHHAEASTMQKQAPCRSVHLRLSVFLDWPCASACAVCRCVGCPLVGAHVERVCVIVLGIIFTESFILEVCCDVSGLFFSEGFVTGCM